MLAMLCSRRTMVTAWSTISSSIHARSRQRSSVSSYSARVVPFSSETTFLRSFASKPRRLRASPANDGDNNNDEEPSQKDGLNRDRPLSARKASKKSFKPKSQKFRIRDDVPPEVQLEKLVAAFDELARKEGFDSTTSHFAESASFEDEFIDDDDDDDEEVGIESADEEGQFAMQGKEDRGVRRISLEEDESAFDASQFTIQDFMPKDDEDDDEDNDEPQTKSRKGRGAAANDDDDMDARIAAAKRDMDMGRISVPTGLDTFARDATATDLIKLGFRREVNPFGDDETPRKRQFKLITNAMTCSACGADFQCTNEKRPGYLPPEKFEIQTKLSKIEEMQNLQEKADAKEWSTEDEIEWLVQTTGKTNKVGETADFIDVDSMAEEMGLDLFELSRKKTICKRCHGLQNFGKVDEALRPGWTREPLMSQDKFRELLRPIRNQTAVIIAMVDLFDFSGSVLPELDNIAGTNPVILAANKVDLLPKQMGRVRAENWVRRELEYLGVQSLANIGGAVRLISCRTGDGVAAMLDKARSIADELDCDIYVVGAANAGKSTLLNQILGRENLDEDKSTKKVRAGNKNSMKGAVTTSPLPGTTLRFIKVDLGGGRSLYDTPGLLVPGTLTQLLTPEELKIVVPQKAVEPVTFRLSSGKCVLVGGLARVELVGDSRPFLFTFYVANEIKLHPTDCSRADEFIEKHVGEILTPPLAPGPERMEQLGEFDEHVVNIKGAGWKEAGADITLTGLGWVSVTGAGSATVRIMVPKGIAVSVRPPLMPFDIWDYTARYTGGRAVRKISKNATGRKRKGVGRN